MMLQPYENITIRPKCGFWQWFCTVRLNWAGAIRANFGVNYAHDAGLTIGQGQRMNFGVNRASGVGWTCSSCWPAVQRPNTVLRLTPSARPYSIILKYPLNNESNPTQYHKITLHYYQLRWNKYVLDKLVPIVILLVSRLPGSSSS